MVREAREVGVPKWTARDARLSPCHRADHRADAKGGDRREQRGSPPARTPAVPRRGRRGPAAPSGPGGRRPRPRRRLPPRRPPHLALLTLRDTTAPAAASGDARLLPWPRALARFLDGRTTVTLVDHVHGHEIGTAEAVLGSGEGRVA